MELVIDPAWPRRPESRNDPDAVTRPLSAAGDDRRLSCPRVIAADTDWIAIAAYYQALALAAPSPIVEINRAAAVGMAFGPAQGLAIADALRGSQCLKDLHLLPTVRGDLLEKLGRVADARAEFRHAAALTGNDKERALLLARADNLQ